MIVLNHFDGDRMVPQPIAPSLPYSRPTDPANIPGI